MYSCLLKVPIFNQLSDEEQAHIHEYIRPVKYAKGEFVQLAGDYQPRLLILNRGAVKLTRSSSDGSEQLLRNLSPGDYIGDTAAFTNVPADYDAVALTDASFCSLRSEDLHNLLRAYPELAIKIISDLSLKLTNAERQIESLTLKSADERLLQTLSDYADGRTSFSLLVSKKDLAGQIGIRPETLSRSLKRLQQKQLVKINGKVVSLLNNDS